MPLGLKDPLSRLEYPWEQTVIAIGGSASYSSLEFNAEWSGTLNVASNPKAQDSDWTFGDLPNQKTLFDEAEASIRCWIPDLSCNMVTPLAVPVRGVNTRGVMEDLDGSSGVVVTKYIEGAKSWSEQKYLGVSGTLFF